MNHNICVEGEFGFVLQLSFQRKILSRLVKLDHKYKKKSDVETWLSQTYLQLGTEFKCLTQFHTEIIAYIHIYIFKMHTKII